MRFLLSNGGLYKICNGNLFCHGCVLLDEDGMLKEISLAGNTYKGKEWYDFLDSSIRKGFFSTGSEELRLVKDLMWYIWLHPNSPLFRKDKMATFERYFINETRSHVETKKSILL